MDIQITSMEREFRSWLKAQENRGDAISYLAKDANDFPPGCGTLEAWLLWAIERKNYIFYRNIVDAWMECFPFYPSEDIRHRVPYRIPYRS